MYGHARYIQDIFNPVSLLEKAQCISDSIEFIKDNFDSEINSIAVAGVSGLAVGSVVSALSKIPLIIVRKDDKRHSEHDVEFPLYLPDDGYAYKYIIVDDLISSGDTIRRIIGKIAEEYPNSYCIKIYLYSKDYYGGKETDTEKEFGYYIPIEKV